MQRHAVDQLHRIVLQAVILADAIDWNDIGVMQTGGSLRFTTKPCVVFAIARNQTTDHFQSDVSI